MKYRICDEHNYGDKKVALYQTEVGNAECVLAMLLLEKWGPVCAMPDGEDSAGRARIRAMTPEETAKHAFDISQEAFKIARQRNLMVQLPDLNDINAEKDAKKKTEKV